MSDRFGGGILIQSDGKLFNVRHGEPKEVPQYESHKGYLYAGIYDMSLKKTIQVRVNVLMADTFLSKPKSVDTSSLEVHHIDCDKKNNSVDNLMCCTKKEHNEIHMLLRQQKIKKQKEKVSLRLQTK